MGANTGTFSKKDCKHRLQSFFIGFIIYTEPEESCRDSSIAAEGCNYLLVLFTEPEESRRDSSIAATGCNYLLVLFTEPEESRRDSSIAATGCYFFNQLFFLQSVFGYLQGKSPVAVHPGRRRGGCAPIPSLLAAPFHRRLA